MKFPRIPRIHLARSMEAIAAVAILMAFCVWRRRGYSPREAFDCVLIVVIGFSAMIIASVFFGAGPSNRHGVYRVSRVLGLLNVLIAFWFLSVESCWIYEDCPRCHSSRLIVEYRFLSRRAYRRLEREEPSLFQLIATDLGVPCSHSDLYRILDQRWRGCCLLVRPAPARIHSDPHYPPCARAAVRSWLADDPDLSQTFERRAFDQDDRHYRGVFMLEMYRACPPDQRPKWTREPIEHF
jgi:hypothetical protein